MTHGDWDLKGLSDNELLQGLTALIGSERRTLARIIAHLDRGGRPPAAPAARLLLHVRLLSTAPGPERGRGLPTHHGSAPRAAISDGFRADRRRRPASQ